ncbi:MAG: thioredoxin-disulfide reductase [Candidatus Hydrogenedentes bacterium]|nr:thioredoxin-disulfide reductase [Candidatus Hydrogenedentota bacterium]
MMEKIVILGGGPAGCTAALYTARADLKPLVLEGEISQTLLPGGQLMTTTEVENFPGYPEGVSGPELMADLKKQAEKFGARFEYKTVTSVDLSGYPLKLFVNEEVYETQALIIATGATARYLGLESEQRFMNKGVSACATCDGALPRFRGKPMVVVGGGDSAMEEALFLTKFADRVHVVHRRDKLRASKIMGDRVLNHPKITMEWNSVVDEILGNDSDGVTGVRLKDTRTGELREVPCSGYFAAIGHQPNTELFKGILELEGSGYLVTQKGSTYTSVPGVFACGDVQDKTYRQAITAAGSGCMAALDAARWLESREET